MANQYGDLSGPLYVHTVVPKHAAGSTDEYCIFRAPFNCKVQKVTIVPAANVTGQATNYTNINIKSWTDGATPVATEIANRDYNSSAVTEVAMKARDIYAPTTYLSMSAGEYLSLEEENVGTGLALPSLGVIVTYEKN